MSASISDPFVLSTYDLSDRFAQSEGPSHVFVTHQSAVGGREGEGYAAVTAQRDGIHVLDVRHTGFIHFAKRIVLRLRLTDIPFIFIRIGV